jgi:antitoxin component of MazEF toxin-antitoxin module
MTVTKLTNSGEVVIPPEIIEWLNLKPGNSIDASDRVRWQGLFTTRQD